MSNGSGLLPIDYRLRANLWSITRLVDIVVWSVSLDFIRLCWIIKILYFLRIDFNFQMYMNPIMTSR